MGCNRLQRTPIQVCVAFHNQAAAISNQHDHLHKFVTTFSRKKLDFARMLYVEKVKCSHFDEPDLFREVVSAHTVVQSAAAVDTGAARHLKLSFALSVVSG